MKTITYLSIVSIIVLSGCKSTNQITLIPQPEIPSAEVVEPVFSPGPPTIVYKTRSDYREHVPVLLSPDKSKLESFPAPGDLFYNGILAYPLQLEEGWLLDVRGINEHVAFIKTTYETYSRMASTPESSELLDLILDDDPLTEMYHCGNKQHFKQPVNDLNKLIKQGGLEKCKKLK